MSIYGMTILEKANTEVGFWTKLLFRTSVPGKGKHLKAFWSSEQSSFQLICARYGAYIVKLCVQRHGFNVFEKLYILQVLFHLRPVAGCWPRRWKSGQNTSRSNDGKHVRLSPLVYINYSSKVHGGSSVDFCKHNLNFIFLHILVSEI